MAHAPTCMIGMAMGNNGCFYWLYWINIKIASVAKKTFLSIALWSRGNDLISNQFPEIMAAADSLPYGVYDGEILAWKDDVPLPFFELQKRLNRKQVSSKLQSDSPCVMKLYDCIEHKGNDVRQLDILKRRQLLTNLNDPFLVSESLSIQSIAELNTYIKNAREEHIEGNNGTRLAIINYILCTT